MTADILLTGAGGFVGRALAPALVRRGYVVHPLGRADGDIATIRPAVPARCIVHLAARIPSRDAADDFQRVNVEGTRNMLDHARRHGARFVFLSSYVYGHPVVLPTPEDHPVVAHNEYAASKIAAEQAVRASGVPAAIIRPFNIYGPGQPEGMLLATILRQTLDPERLRVEVQDNSTRRDYLCIDDLVELILATVEQSAEGTYNAGTGRSYSPAEVAELAAQATGVRKPFVVVGQPRAGDVPDTRADIGKAQRELGWEPRIPLEEGLHRLIA